MTAIVPVLLVVVAVTVVATSPRLRRRVYVFRRRLRRHKARRNSAD